MADGDNTEEDAQRIKDLETELAKQKEIVVNAEKKLNEFGNEIGEARKTVKELADLKAELIELKKGQETAGTSNKTIDEEVKELEESLTDHEQGVLDAAFKNANEETRKKIANDPKIRKKFLSTAKQMSVDVAPQDWRKNPAKQGEGTSTKDEIAELFNKQKQRHSFTPSGPSGGENRANGNDIYTDHGPARRTPIADSVLGRRT